VLLIVERSPPVHRLRIYGFTVRPKKIWGQLVLGDVRPTELLTYALRAADHRKGIALPTL
jgi:hypothetical protein